MSARVSQAGLLPVTVGAPTARVSQAGVLAIYSIPHPLVRVSQAGVLAVTQAVRKARVSQAGVLVPYRFPGVASARIVFTATSPAVKPAAARVVYSAVANESGAFHRSADASVIFSAAAFKGRVVSSTAAASLIYSAVASQVALRTFHEAASAVIVFRARSSATGGPQTAATTANASIIYRARVGLLRKLLEFPGNYLGRFQVGQEVPLGLDTLSRRGSLVVPNAVPTARVYRDGVLVRTFRQPREFDSEDRTRFYEPFVLGREDFPGRYCVVFYYGASGVVRVGFDIFEVVRGGDPGGPVLAVYSLERPQGAAVVVHLGAGALVSGADPTLDEGL